MAKKLSLDGKLIKLSDYSKKIGTKKDFHFEEWRKTVFQSENKMMKIQIDEEKTKHHFKDFDIDDVNHIQVSMIVNLDTSQKKIDANYGEEDNSIEEDEQD